MRLQNSYFLVLILFWLPLLAEEGSGADGSQASPPPAELPQTQSTTQKTKNDFWAGKTVPDFATGNRIVQERFHNAPLVGEKAPDFSLELKDSSQCITLSEFCQDKPVVLVFGSFT